MVTLLQNLPSIITTFSGNGVVLYRYDGPLFFKILKDCLFLLLLGIMVGRAAQHRRLPLTALAAGMVVLAAGLAAISWLEGGLMMAMVGLRWLLPLILFMAMKEWSRDIDFSSAIPWLILGMLLCLFVQLLQLFLMTPIFGQILPGIAARTPGIFIAPNTTSFFAATSAALCMVLKPDRRWFQVRVLALAFTIAVLTQSGTGLVAVSVLGLRCAFSRQRTLFWLIALVAIIVVFPNLDSLTMRKDYVELSGGGRIDALLRIVSNAWQAVNNFGLYTNAANLLSSHPELQIAPDSLVASWIGNFGAFTLVATLLMIGFVALNMRDIDWTRALPCVLVFVIFAMTTVVFEAFPMNLYLALGIWAARKPSKLSSYDSQTHFA